LLGCVKQVVATQSIFARPIEGFDDKCQPTYGETVMSKEQHSTKENKKKPLLTAKEKKAAKKTKKDTNVIGQ